MMRPATALLAFTALHPLTAAINVRIGRGPKVWTDYGWEASVAMYVFGDNWQLKDGGVVEGVFQYSQGKELEGFCSGSRGEPSSSVNDSDVLFPGCPVQASLAGYGLRVIKDDGTPAGNLLLDTWHTHNGQYVTRSGWCGRMSSPVSQGEDTLVW